MSDTLNNALELTRSAVANDIPSTYTKNQTSDALRNMIIELNGGSDKLTAKSFRRAEMYDYVEELINIVANEGLKGDEFFMNYVDYKNLAEGDQNIFYTEDTEGFLVSEIGRGNQGIRRQRLNAGEQISVPTTTKAVRIYEHLSRLLAGRVDFNTMIQRVGTSVAKKRYEDIYTLFTSITAATPGMNSDVVCTGSYDENKVLKVIEHVEADNDATAVIIGTKGALRKLKTDTDLTSNQARDDMYNVGYYGKFNGTPTYRINSRYKTGTRDFIFPDNQLYVVAGPDRFIKYVTEGNGVLNTIEAVENMDLTQEYVYIEQTGVALLLGHAIGLVTFDN